MSAIKSSGEIVKTEIPETQTSEQNSEVGNTQSQTSLPSVSVVSEDKVVRMSIIGNIDPFTFDGKKDLDKYLGRMEHVFKINKVENDMKISFLISLAGEKFYDRVLVVINLKELKDLTYDQLIEILRTNFKPVKNVRAERYKFLSRSMIESETIEEFAVEIKNLAKTCDYGIFLDNMLCDKLILSIRDSGTQKRFMEEPLTKSFAEICEKALTLELT